MGEVDVLRLPAWDECADAEEHLVLSGWPAQTWEALLLPEPHEKDMPLDNEDEARVGGDGLNGDGNGDGADHGHAHGKGDPYALLGLASKRWTATQEEIRSAYRKVVLKCHPDKRHDYAKERGEEPLEEEEANARFRELQEAFETLNDPKKRREFDSGDSFNGAIPKPPLPSSADFFAEYGLVFERYSRWSERRPVPQLGSPQSPWSDVAAFYNFWFDFRSWRVFVAPDEHDLSEAEFREERRWMERQNEKARASLKKEETARIAKLVEDAYTQDPRVRAHREAERAEKERAKREAADRARRETEAADARAQAEAVAAEEAKRQAQEEATAKKRAKERERDALRKARARVKGLASPLGAEGPGKERVAVLCAELRSEELTLLANKLEVAGGDVTELARIVDEVSAPILAGLGVKIERAAWGSSGAGASAGDEPAANKCGMGSGNNGDDGNGADGKPTAEESRTQPAAASDATEETAASAPATKAAAREVAPAPGAPSRRERVWTDRELALLHKGGVKFPAGIPSRWGKVAEFINDVTGGSLTEKQVSEQVKAMRKIQTAPAVARGAAERAAVGAQHAATGAVASSAARESVQPPSATAAVGADGASWDLAIPAAVAAKANGSRADRAPAIPAPALKETVSRRPLVATAKEAESVGAKHPAAADHAAAAGEWTPAQQAALEAALKSVPKKADDRWVQIAAAVPGKTKAECIARFKHLAAMVSAKKAAQS